MFPLSLTTYEMRMFLLTISHNRGRQPAFSPPVETSSKAYGLVAERSTTKGCDFISYLSGVNTSLIWMDVTSQKIFTLLPISKQPRGFKDTFEVWKTQTQGKAEILT